MRQQVAPQAGLSNSINDIGVIGRAMHVRASPCFPAHSRASCLLGSNPSHCGPRSDRAKENLPDRPRNANRHHCVFRCRGRLAGVHAMVLVLAG
jgi:hypothetical protein